MRVLWTEIKYIKSASRLLDRDWVNKRGLDLSKVVLWVSVGWGATEVPAIKVGGLKKNSANRPAWTWDTCDGHFFYSFFTNLQLIRLVFVSFKAGPSLWAFKTSKLINAPGHANLSSEFAFNVDIASINNHPGYEVTQFGSVNDIALLKLSEHLKLNFR